MKSLKIEKSGFVYKVKKNFLIFFVGKKIVALKPLAGTVKHSLLIKSSVCTIR